MISSTPTLFTGQSEQRLNKLQSQRTSLQNNIDALSARYQSLLDVSSTPSYRFRSIRIKQRSDIITTKAELETSRYLLARTEFELKHHAGTKTAHTEVTVKDLWDLLVKALRFWEEVQGLEDEVRRLSRDFSNDTFWGLRSEMRLFEFRAKRLLRGVRREIRKAERAVERKKT